MAPATVNMIRADDGVVDFVEVRSTSPPSPLRRHTHHHQKESRSVFYLFSFFSHSQADSVMSTQAPTKKDNVVLYPQSVNATKSDKQCQAQLEATWGLVRTGERTLNINGEYYYEASGFDIVFGVYLGSGIFFRRLSRLHAAPHPACDALFSVSIRVAC